MKGKLFELLPNIEPEEMTLLEGLTEELDEKQLKNFAIMYSSKRKDPQTILITTLVGFLGVAGIQRFLLDQVGMGILYLLTGGLCAIGTIMDIVNYKTMTSDYNQMEAQKIIAMIKS